ncbi:hypothetical protein [Shinella pollutisoli]|uniref:Uncharacterized protein n=1 Tax=Shinella pollutisoli TaxID=2250594 RepID=A0ABV7DGB1_9HYPH|nr:hypothetical protein [Shinella pollutisoli]
MTPKEAAQAATSGTERATVVTGETEALRAQVSTLRARYGRIEIALNKSLARVEALEPLRQRLESQVAELERENKGLRKKLQSLGNEKEKLGKSLETAERESKDAKSTLTRLRSSVSWRITAPLRRLGRSKSSKKK